MANFLVLTGGSSGIGEKTIKEFSQQGWHTVNISRTPCPVDKVKNFSIDLTKTNAIKAHESALLAELKSADKICLVHNAAAFKRDNVMDLSEDDLRSVLEINLVAAVSLNRILLPLMKPGSSIIYIGSTLSEMAVPNRASYVISKHALVGLMRSTCQDLAGKEITTCCICPGFVNTNMLTAGADKIALENFLKQKVTAQRAIEPEEIATLIYFAANNPILNGAVLHSNLGQVMS